MVPPPWLIAMQRYGPPPTYPNLKIPGLNAPIPEVRATFFNLYFIYTVPVSYSGHLQSAFFFVLYWCDMSMVVIHTVLFLLVVFCSCLECGS